MKNSFLASPQLAKFVFIKTIVTSVIILFISLFFKNNLWLAAIMFVILLAFTSVSMLIKYKNAFVKIVVNEEGIKNKWFALKWEDISSYELLEVYAYWGHKNPKYKIECSSVVCFGKISQDKKFIKQNPHETICVSLTPKQLQIIETYGKGKSEKIDEILNFYYYNQR
ncbi:MAG: hypothetical protein J6A83_06385 [Clostridia bacterium]|nr:hypothetical protein [Clostridia bacterium]